MASRSYIKRNWLGMRFGKLTIIELLPYPKLLAKCDCGNIIKVVRCSLVSKNSVTCGCGKIDWGKKLGALNITHGHTSGKRSVEYVTWWSMIERCYYPSQDNYERYGGRGIKVCKRWRNSFKNFLADMGFKPVGLSIDRRNPNGNYTPENCRWADKYTQRGNRRV